MVQAGGWITSEDGTKVTADSPENLEALEYVKSLLDRRARVKYPKQLDAGWGGEAFGKGKAAMTIEGNWIKGAMTERLPDVEYTVRRAAGRPGGQGHAVVHPVLGHRGQEQARRPAIDFVEAMTAPDQQLAVRQGVRRDAVAAVGRARATSTQFPDDTAFVDGAEYAQGPVNAAEDGQRAGRLRRRSPGAAQRRPEADPRALQKNAEAVIGS